ncbi:MAG TPA: FecR domain-containing protein [Rhizomicrobium sp.]|nr:FecR domain-containing protein [Rhizomicrobium sp.]
MTQRGESAQDVRLAAAGWLEKSQRLDWSEADQAALDEWLGLSLAHRTAYWRVKDAWSRTDRLRALGASARDEQAPERPSLMPLFLKFAAGLAAIAVIGIGTAAYISKSAERTYSTDIGGRELVTFADGTKIELNTNTIIRTRMTTDERAVWLDQGEAFFRVHHDSAHPFVVYAGSRRVTDLGTEFLMRRETGKLKVALLQGRVRIGEADGVSRGTLLKPGDEATATAHSLVVKHAGAGNLENEIAWRNGMLAFKYTPLSAAVAEFNRYNRQKMLIADPAAAKLTIYGTFPADDVEAFVDVARHVLKLHVAHEGGDIVITR